MTVCATQHLGETACAGAAAVAALAGEEACRSQLASAGALHALLPAALRYDYTLAESGVDTDAHVNKQVLIIPTETVVMEKWDRQLNQNIRIIILSESYIINTIRIEYWQLKTHTHTHIYTHTRTRAHMHTSTRAHAHTYTHACALCILYIQL